MRKSDCLGFAKKDFTYFSVYSSGTRPITARYPIFKIKAYGIHFCYPKSKNRSALSRNGV
jgi:hypothetical protein